MLSRAQVLSLVSPGSRRSKGLPFRHAGHAGAAEDAWTFAVTAMTLALVLIALLAS